MPRVRDGYAFFVALKELDREGLLDLMSGADAHALAAWKADGLSTARFFLDAVDELKLTRSKLERVLGRIAKDLDGHLDRAHTVILSRPGASMRPSRSGGGYCTPRFGLSHRSSTRC